MRDEGPVMASGHMAAGAGAMSGERNALETRLTGPPRLPIILQN
jgi:hypothetical protein